MQIGKEYRNGARSRTFTMRSGRENFFPANLMRNIRMHESRRKAEEFLMQIVKGHRNAARSPTFTMRSWSENLFSCKFNERLPKTKSIRSETFASMNTEEFSMQIGKGHRNAARSPTFTMSFSCDGLFSFLATVCCFFVVFLWRGRWPLRFSPRPRSLCIYKEYTKLYCRWPCLVLEASSSFLQSRLRSSQCRGYTELYCQVTTYTTLYCKVTTDTIVVAIVRPRNAAPLPS